MLVSDAQCIIRRAGLAMGSHASPRPLPGSSAVEAALHDAWHGSLHGPLRRPPLLSEGRTLSRHE